MSLSKYQIILSVLAITSLALFTVVDYFAFYTPESFITFMLVELCAVSVVMFTIIIALRLKTIVFNEGFKQLSDNEIYELKNKKIREGITNAMNTEKYLNTNTIEGVTFDRVMKDD